MRSSIKLLLLTTACCCVSPQWVGSEYTVPKLAEVYSEVSIRVEADTTIKIYKVQEYIDMRGNLSLNGGVTIRIKDVTTGLFSTYYNSGDERSFGRMTRFDEDEQVCILEHQSKWRLSGITRMIFFLPIEYGIRVDSSKTLGTTSLLVLANKIGKELVMKGKSYDPRRQMDLNYYVATFKIPPEDVDFRQLVIKMVVATRAATSNEQKGAKYADYSGPQAPVRVQLLLMNSDSSSEDDLLDRDVSKFLELSESALGVTIDYYLVQPIADMSAIRSPILSVNNPLTLPVGIGCWVNRIREPFHVSEGQRFSGQYMINGLMPGYIAYDSATDTARIDHWNTKVIYNFRRRLLYNIDLGAATDEPLSAPANETVTSGAATSDAPPVGIADQENRVCGVTLITDNSYLAMMSDGIHSILGFATHQKPLFRMGRAEHEGVECDVYEREYTDPLAPLVFGHMVLEQKKGLKYYLVAYIVPESGKSDTGHSYEGLVKRIELRSYNLNTKERGWLKTVNFASFAWSLEVPPLEGRYSPQLQASQLMSTRECSASGSAQLMLKFSLEPDSRNEIDTLRDLHRLRRQTSIIQEEMMKKMLNTAQYVRPV